jgi:hypothetical protein
MGREVHIAAELESSITNDLTEFVASAQGDAAIAVGRAGSLLPESAWWAA